MKRVVITGITSMLGGALAKQCALRGIEVLGLVRVGSSRNEQIPRSPLIRVIPCGLDQMHDYVPEDGASYDVFYHFAWEGTSKAHRHDPSIQERNIRYALDACILAKRLECKLFIGAGSQAEYGSNDCIITEETPANPEMAYGIAKNAAGQLSRKLCEDIGLGHIWARIFSVYGPNDNEGTMIRATLEKILRGERLLFTPAEQDWDYLYCDDAADAFIRIGASGVSGNVYNLASGVSHPLRWFIERLIDVSDSPVECEIGALPYTGGRIPHLRASIEKLATDTGFRATTSFQDGIRRTLEWTKEKMREKDFRNDTML